jgi:hypothetical protein
MNESVAPYSKQDIYFSCLIMWPIDHISSFRSVQAEMIKTSVISKVSTTLYTLANTAAVFVIDR